MAGWCEATHCEHAAGTARKDTGLASRPRRPLREVNMARLTMLGPRVATLDTSIAAPPPKVADSFYTSREWRELIASIKTERGPTCQRCGRKYVRLFGDHTVELKDGGAKLDRRNVVLMCGSCHTAKTARARAERMKG